MSNFTPTHDWKPIPDGAICPPGLEFRIDLNTGHQEARLPPFPVIDLNDAGPQITDYAGPAWPTSSDHDEIKQALRASAEGLVSYIRGEDKNRALS